MSSGINTFEDKLYDWSIILLVIFGTVTSIFFYVYCIVRFVMDMFF